MRQVGLESQDWRLNKAVQLLTSAEVLFNGGLINIFRGKKSSKPVRVSCQGLCSVLLPSPCLYRQ